MHYTPIIYLVLCLLIGILGIRRKLGFWGYFFASLALTPLLGFLLLMVSDPRKRSADT